MLGSGVVSASALLLRGSFFGFLFATGSVQGLAIAPSVVSKVSSIFCYLS